MNINLKNRDMPVDILLLRHCSSVLYVSSIYEKTSIIFSRPYQLTSNLNDLAMTFQKLKRVAISDGERCLQRLPKKNTSFVLIFLLAVCMNASAQQITVKGKVTSGNEALAGVTISEKNKNNKTQTDSEGNYAITTDSNSTIVFSHVGFIAQEVAVSNRWYINIELPAANQKLNDVVVVGYKNLLL